MLLVLIIGNKKFLKFSILIGFNLYLLRFEFYFYVDISYRRNVYFLDIFKIVYKFSKGFFCLLMYFENKENLEYIKIIIDMF